jgi:dihydrodipicolinate synthase/N-acetylneuraminate lyase
MNNKKKYGGVVVPVITPLTASYTLDREAVEKIFSSFRTYHAMPFILGTTGEAASLPLAVKHDYIKASARFKAGNDILYAGISSNNLEESVELANRSFDAGVDVVVATLPSYYALTAGAMKNYFEQLADRVQGPLMIYNIPATTHMSIPLNVIDELSHHQNIVGLKDSERSEERLQTALKLWSKRNDFSHFTGWAARSADALLAGGDGIIPSTANLNPALYNELYTAAQTSDKEKALRCQQQADMAGNIYQSGRTLGESLWALKVLMKKAGLCESYMMPPLQELSQEEEKKLWSAYEV